MSTFRSDNKAFSQLMQKGKLEMPFSDFEETVMCRIQNEVEPDKKIVRPSKISFLFFILGTTLGLVLNSFLQNYHQFIFGMSPQNILLLFQVGFVLVFLIQLDGFLRLYVKRRRIA